MYNTLMRSLSAIEFVISLILLIVVFVIASPKVGVGNLGFLDFSLFTIEYTTFGNSRAKNILHFDVLYVAIPLVIIFLNNMFYDFIVLFAEKLRFLKYFDTGYNPKRWIKIGIEAILYTFIISTLSGNYYLPSWIIIPLIVLLFCIAGFTSEYNLHKQHPYFWPLTKMGIILALIAIQLGITSLEKSNVKSFPDWAIIAMVAYFLYLSSIILNITLYTYTKNKLLHESIYYLISMIMSAVTTSSLMYGVSKV